MKRTPRAPRKLLKLKRETVRQLGHVELTHAAGGGPAAADTTDATCPWTHLANSGACGGG